MPALDGTMQSGHIFKETMTLSPKFLKGLQISLEPMPTQGHTPQMGMLKLFHTLQIRTQTLDDHLGKSGRLFKALNQKCKISSATPGSANTNIGHTTRQPNNKPQGLFDHFSPKPELNPR